MSKLLLRSVSVSLDGRRVVSEVGLEVASGEWLGVIGPNGAGKSTLLRAVAGLVGVQGSIEVGGRSLSTMPRRERSRLVALVPQRPQLPAEMRVVDYVSLGRTPHLSYLAVEGSRDVAAVGRAIERMDLSGLATRRLGSLSGGEVQRAVLARALAQEAPVLLLDEPTASLDLGHSQQVLELIDELRRQGLVVVSALHDLTSAARFCGRLVLLSDGRAVASGIPATVIDEETIGRHYGARVRVVEDETGSLVVIPLRHGVPVATMAEATP
jgi:iron complex transport system ATP-binding protein